jgi:outer membrane receptor protein involved in Fe transport
MSQVKGKRTRRKAGAVALSLALLPTTVWGDEVDKLIAGAPDGEPIELSEVELGSLLDLEVGAATRKKTPIAELPSTASAVTREQILDYGWRSINDMLYTLPGFAPSQDWERRLAGFRGERERWNANRLLLTVDGMSHNNIETGAAFTWETTPLFFARQVEVVRGPASAVYGSNAMHGVVALQTVTADDLGDGGVEARVRAGGKSQAVDAVGAQKGTWADAVIGLSGHITDGDEYLDTDDSYRMDADGRPAEMMVQDERAASYLWLKINPKAAAKGLEISFHRQADESETSHGWGDWLPDVGEYVREQRTMVDATYRRPMGRFTLETAGQYQRQDYQAAIRFYPAGAFEGYYPQGVTEAVDTSFDSLGARGQLELALPRGATALAGVDYQGVLYGGDEEHYSNADLLDPAGEYPQLDGYRPLGPVYEPILDRPVHRVGVYGQAVTGALLGEHLELTAGVRYDDLFYTYEDIADPARPEVSDSQRQVSPRVGLVVRPADGLRLKLMAGHAFRTPTLVELFAANGWTATSNPKQLRPETSNSYEAAVDWAPIAPLRVRGNAFYLDHRNIIDYQLEDGLLYNVSSSRRVGGELEVVGQTQVAGIGLDGFASYSHVRLVDETIFDETLSEEDRLSWAPSHLVKAGMRVGTARVGGTVTAYWQGTTRRRASDRMDEMWNQLRPAEIAPWLTTSATLFARPTPGLKLGLEGTNLLGTGGRIVAPGSHSFDYRVAPREIMGVAEMDL